MTLNSRAWLLLVAFAAWSCPVVAQLTASQADALGFTSLRSRLGAANMPTGAGIVVEQVEATESGAYLPNWSDSAFTGKNFIDQSNGGGAVSSHATAVAFNFYGLGSIAPGITTIDVFEANHWLGSGYLNWGQGTAPAALPANGPKVINNSWIGTNNSFSANDALRRLDYAIGRDDTVVVVGVNNGAATQVPALLASSYNSIAVGLSNGQSSYGPTQYGEVAGRSKPDLVAPNSKTSYATAQVSGAAALLLQVANGNSAYAQAVHSESVKAILMAGASKDAWSDWTHSTTQPLDTRYGAGQVNIDRSYQILNAGQQSPGNSSLVSATGWSYNALNTAGAQKYFFDVTDGLAKDFSAVLTWDRHVGGTPSFTPTLATFQLKLYQAGPGFTVGTLVDQSISTIDNVQHIFERALPGGSYVLEVARTDSAGAWDYALAWQLLAQPQWNGAGNGTNWSEAANWGGAAPTAPRELNFGSLSLAGHAANTNDFASGTQFNGIVFKPGATVYSLQGNRILLGGAIVNQSNNDQSITLDLQFTSGGGDFDTGTRTLSVSGSLTGSAGLVKTGSGRLLLSGVNSYSGGTTVASGTLQAARPASLPGYGTAGKVSVASQAMLAVNTGSSAWTAADLDALRANASFSPGAILGLDTSGAAAGFAYGGNLSGVLGVNKLGNNTLTLSGLNTYTGGTVVSNGTLQIAAAGSLPAGGKLTIQSGGTLVLQSQLGSATGVAGANLPAIPLALEQPLPSYATGDFDAGAHVVPEPSALALLSCAALALLAWRRLRRR